MFRLGGSLVLVLLFVGCVPVPASQQPAQEVPSPAVSTPAEVPVASSAEIRFKASDGVELFADLHRAAAPDDAPVIILFHQAGGSARGEYKTIAPRLVEAGYHVLAVDQRSGGDRFGDPNRTALALGQESGYCDAYPDLEAALAYPPSVALTGPRIVWGSSYSAGLVFKLAAEHPSEITGLLAFSPAGGDPMQGCKPTDFLAQLRVPALSLRPENEAAMEPVIAQTAVLEGAGVKTHVASPGVHGSSMLVSERAGGDTEPTWSVVMRFLGSIVPTAGPNK